MTSSKYVCFATFTIPDQTDFSPLKVRSKTIVSTWSTWVWCSVFVLNGHLQLQHKKVYSNGWRGQYKCRREIHWSKQSTIKSSCPNWKHLERKSLESLCARKNKKRITSDMYVSKTTINIVARILWDDILPQEWTVVWYTSMAALTCPGHSWTRKHGRKQMTPIAWKSLAPHGEKHTVL